MSDNVGPREAAEQTVYRSRNLYNLYAYSAGKWSYFCELEPLKMHMAEMSDSWPRVPSAPDSLASAALSEFADQIQFPLTVIERKFAKLTTTIIAY